MTSAILKRAACAPALLALALCACTKNPNALQVKYSGPYPDAHYLTEAQLDNLVRTFPPPPEPGSAQEQADLALLLELQGKRTPLQCAAALVQEKSDFPEYFGGDANPFQKPEAKPVLDFFQKTGDDVKLATARLKSETKRKRPEDPRLKPCLRDVGSKYSYPSIHAAVARAFALILSDLDPARKDEYISNASAAARNRLIAGVHYPSDVTAGEEYGARVYRELLADEDFRKELESLRRHLKK